jgi:hypothetical protein
MDNGLCIKRSRRQEQHDNLSEHCASSDNHYHIKRHVNRRATAMSKRTFRHDRPAVLNDEKYGSRSTAAIYWIRLIVIQNMLGQEQPQSDSSSQMRQSEVDSLPKLHTCGVSQSGDWTLVFHVKSCESNQYAPTEDSDFDVKLSQNIPVMLHFPCWKFVKYVLIYAISLPDKQWHPSIRQYGITLSALHKQQ